MKKIILYITMILYTFSGQISTVFANPDANIQDAPAETVLSYINEAGEIVPPKLLAEGAVLMNADTGEVLFDKGMNERLYPASITKIMTAILAIENGKLDDLVYFSEEAVKIEPGSSSIGMKPGEVITLDEALNGLMIHSANEVGNAVGEYVSGSIEAFCGFMTERAVELGAENTNFTNPHGLHSENHYTTPYDMALIFRQGLQYPYFREVIKKMYFELPKTNITDEIRYIYGKNRIIMKDSPYYYEFCQGGKTGFTNEAMHTLVTYAEKDGKRLIAAVMKAPANGTYTDSRALYEYGFNYFRNEEIFNSDMFYEELPVIQQYQGETIERGAVFAVPESSVSKTLREDAWEKGVTHEISLPDTLLAPVKNGDVIGKITFYSENTEIASVSLLAKGYVSALSEEEIKTQKREEFIIDTKSKLPVYMTFVPIIILISSVLISLLVKLIRARRERNRFNFSSKSKKYKFKKY